MIEVENESAPRANRSDSLQEDGASPRRVGDLLVDSGLVERSVVESAAAEAATIGKRIGEVLVGRAAVPERDLYAALAKLNGVRFADESDLIRIADPQLIARVPVAFLERQGVLPVAILEDRLIVATSDASPEVPELADALGARCIEYRLVTPTDFRRLRLGLAIGAFKPGLGSAKKVADRDLVSARPELDAEAVSLFDAVLLEAIAERASDIHLERYGERVLFRLRVDGDLHDVESLRITPEQYLGLVNVIKIRADLDIAERRIPQGGRFSAAAAGHLYDLRAQTQPALYGEHIVIRLLSKEMEQVYIPDLGLPPDLAKHYQRVLESPSGLLLVVGPTGCGKSTTLYAGLHRLAKDRTRKVMTIEDPVESAVERVQQSAVRPELGFTFANAMRAFVREDPDVIMLGEIRDGETALEALRASQTGHVVLSTLHCNDTVDAVQRLVDLGMHPNSIASELLAVIAQRLAKRICTLCREECDPSPDIVREVFTNEAREGFRAFRGRGCGHCGGLGTFGRIAVVELLDVGPELRRAISRRATLDELRDLAHELGLVSMREHALTLVQDGIIALEELPVMFSLEQLAPWKRHGG